LILHYKDPIKHVDLIQSILLLYFIFTFWNLNMK
jgi:hypothetical protein